MHRTELLQRIRIDPQICQGSPCIKGTDVPVRLILEDLAQGCTLEEIKQTFPRLVAEDVQAAMVYAVERAAAVEAEEGQAFDNVMGFRIPRKQVLATLSVEVPLGQLKQRLPQVNPDLELLEGNDQE